MKTQRKLILKHRFAGSVLAIIAAGSIAAASAEDAVPRYTLAAISDAAQGRTVLAGKYTEAIDKIDISQRKSIGKYYAANNLCVAQVMTRDLESAVAACDAAVREIRKRLDGERFFPGFSAKESEYRRYLAIALSNRGVLRAVNGALDKAEDDFREALELEARIEAPRVNLARLSMNTDPAA